MITIKSHEEFEQYLGKELGISNWHPIKQEQINLFADATLDHQWIHIDTEKAATEVTYKTVWVAGPSIEDTKAILPVKDIVKKLVL